MENENYLGLGTEWSLIDRLIAGEAKISGVSDQVERARFKSSDVIRKRPHDWFYPSEVFLL
jgi:hypothetical protein